MGSGCEGGRALSRMASSTGVVDMVDRNRGSRNALGRSIGAHVLWIPWVESDTTRAIGRAYRNSSSALEQVMVIVVRIKESACFRTWLTRLAKTSFTANTCLYF